MFKPHFQVFITPETSRKAVVSWISNSKQLLQDTDVVEAHLKEDHESDENIPVTFYKPFSERRNTCHLEGGKSYTIRVRCLKMIEESNYVCEHVLAERIQKHRSILQVTELYNLFNRARNLTRNDPGQPLKVLYRNKPSIYWNKIWQNHDYVMEPYMKDFCGDPASPINGQLNGLFFAGRLDKDGLLPKKSPFGNTRLIIPVTAICNVLNTNQYFADFYCLQSIHYVTVVITIPGSPADTFCRKNLILLNNFCNPFFMFCQQKYCHLMARKVHVELFYTEPIDLKVVQHCFKKTELSKKTASLFNSVVKNPSCNLCNLYTVKRKRNNSLAEDVSIKKQKLMDGEPKSDHNGNIIKVATKEHHVQKISTVINTDRCILKAKRPKNPVETMSVEDAKKDESKDTQTNDSKYKDVKIKPLCNDICQDVQSSVITVTSTEKWKCEAASQVNSTVSAVVLKTLEPDQNMFNSTKTDVEGAKAEFISTCKNRKNDLHAIATVKMEGDGCYSCLEEKVYSNSSLTQKISEVTASKKVKTNICTICDIPSNQNVETEKCLSDQSPQKAETNQCTTCKVKLHQKCTNSEVKTPQKDVSNKCRRELDSSDENSATSVKPVKGCTIKSTFSTFLPKSKCSEVYYYDSETKVL